MSSQKKIEYLDEQQNVIVIHDIKYGMYPIYIVKGEKNYMVDCGIAPRAKTLKSDIEEALHGETIDVLLLTHSHYDHVGTASYLQKIYDYRIVGSYETVEMLKNEDLREMINYNNRGLKDLYLDEYDPSIQLDELRNLDVVGKGDRLQVDPNRYIEVIPSPGHSTCGLSYLLQPENILFPGDSAGMMEKDGTHKPVFFNSFKQYEQTIDMFAGLNLDIIAFGHANSIQGNDNIKEYCQKAISEAHKLKEKMLFSLKKSLDPMIIAQNIADQEFFPGTVMGPRESHLMNLRALAMVIKREFVTSSYQ